MISSPDPHVTAQFQRYLLPSERILWTGHPPTGIRFQAFDIFLIPFSIVWAGVPVSMLFVGGDEMSGAPLPFRLIPLLFLAVGLYITIGRFIVDMAIRKRTAYAVTDRRVMSVRNVFTTTLQTRDIDRLTALDLKERNNGSGTITFENNPLAYWMRGQEFFAPGLRGVCFFDIPDARAVYDLIARQNKR